MKKVTDKYASELEQGKQQYDLLREEKTDLEREFAERIATLEVRGGEAWLQGTGTYWGALAGVAPRRNAKAGDELPGLCVGAATGACKCVVRAAHCVCAVCRARSWMRWSATNSCRLKLGSRNRAGMLGRSFLLSRCLYFWCAGLKSKRTCALRMTPSYLR
jgi:hypothetical protein